jgi:hypothetical protein
MRRQSSGPMSLESRRGSISYSVTEGISGRCTRGNTGAGVVMVSDETVSSMNCDAFARALLGASVVYLMKDE